MLFYMSSGFYFSRFVALLVDIGLKELRNAESTRIGQLAATKQGKADVVAAQEAKDTAAEAEANKFMKMSKKAKNKGNDDENQDDFDGEENPKKVTKTDANAKGSSTLGGDATTKALAYMMDLQRGVEEQQHREAQAKREDARADARNKNAMDIARMQLEYQYGSRSSSSSSSSYPTVTPAKEQTCSGCGFTAQAGSLFCSSCGLRF